MNAPGAVVIVGAGLAGLAAASAAKHHGAAVTLVRGRAGASALSSGAWDGVASADVARIVGALQLPVVLAAEAKPIGVVGTSGVVRAAAGRDVQLLDVAGRRAIVVPRIAVGAWDADAIADALAPDARAVEASLLRHVDESRMPLADLAALHDEPARLQWLLTRLREALATAGACDAVLLPPILGIDPRTVERLRSALGVDVGESLGEPGGPRAFRYARWVERIVGALDLDVVDGVVERVEASAVHVRLDDGALRSLPASRVVLACGGVAAGGLRFGTGEHESAGVVPATSTPPLRLSLDVVGREVVPAAAGVMLDAAGSLFGVDPERLLLGDAPLLLRAGVPRDGEQRVLDRAHRSIDWLLAAGDLLADAPRTALHALVSGDRAGRAAAAPA